MGNYWLDQAKKRLESESAKNGDVHLDRLRSTGVIDDKGQVTGKVHRWDAFLAVTAVKRRGDREISTFRCLKPVFGIPGTATIDISRESMIDYLKQGKKVITATNDARLNLWKEGFAVSLSPGGFIHVGPADKERDDVGPLPEFRQTTSGL
jgi:hypothetical protein